MRVLGIDPGFGRMGYGIIEEHRGGLRVLDYGCFETKPTERAGGRLRAIRDALAGLLASWKPTLAATESLFFSKNVKTALQVGEARGVILLTVAECALPLIELSPQEVKLAVTGYGNAEKSQVQRMVQRILGLPKPPKPDDAADGLALAIAAAQMRKFLRRL
ncbi:crossover junction endodeoxyribonuclease RuvC [Candidatus Uhrbacteria bacterium]|nr:crossover junction endodeoxyribonuclease RuvC [Candidatus Uhrbacteria bacterium]